MAEITTTKNINVTQFGYEVAKPMHVLQDDDETVIEFDGSAISEADMRAAIDAHVADENWEPPKTPEQEEREQEELTLEDYKARADAGTLTSEDIAPALALFLKLRA